MLSYLNPKSEAPNPKQIQISNVQNPKPISNNLQSLSASINLFICLGHLNFGHLILFRISNLGFSISLLCYGNFGGFVHK